MNFSDFSSILKIATLKADQEVDQDQQVNGVNVNTDTRNSNKSSSSSTTSTSAQNDQTQSNNINEGFQFIWDLYKLGFPWLDSDSNIPCPSSSSDSGAFMPDFSYLDYARSDDESDSEDDELRVSCIICEEMKMTISCGLCYAVYCRRDAIQNIQPLRLSIHDGENNESYLYTYACDSCVRCTDKNFGEWREKKALKLEMLCAFNIARKMWETIYPDKKSIDSKFVMRNSLSIMTLVDQSYVNSPLPIRNLVKKAVLLLGLELDFFASYANNGKTLATTLDDAIHNSDDGNICHSESSSDGKSSFDNDGVDGAEKSDDSANDKNENWEDHKIEWTPQFTIKKLDDHNV